ncbi:UNVERIFIED_CONTAM: hypothetical protein Sangu_1962100 [Sesamum angustifolium]|uniref:MULE transposase domain-containing protein n=1 Tax=Sesamum angustifolium TaxID=2727405 RepID=A0AAW2LXH0_9LAMI
MKKFENVDIDYLEEEEADTLQAIDSQGNPIEKEQEEEIRFLLDGIDFEELGGNEIEGDGRKDCEGQGVEGVEFEGNGRKDCEGQGIEGQGLDRDEIERSDCEGQGVELGVDDNFTEIPIQQEDSNMTDNVTHNITRIFKVMRAKKESLERIRGDDAKHYELLWDYCETIRKCNLGSKLLLRKVENSDPPVSDRMYFSLWALKKGFLEGCRPIIGLDGCFLKTVYGGQLLVAVGRDGNDNMFSIAMAVVHVENRDTWGWFVGELFDDIGGMDTNKWSFISDGQKGIVEALKDLVPESEHRFCLRHMYENFKMKFKSVELKEYFWKAASTANKREFDGFMKKIEELDSKIKAEVETASE